MNRIKKRDGGAKRGRRHAPIARTRTASDAEVADMSAQWKDLARAARSGRREARAILARLHAIRRAIEKEERNDFAACAESLSAAFYEQLRRWRDSPAGATWEAEDGDASEPQDVARGTALVFAEAIFHALSANPEAETFLCAAILAAARKG